MTYIHFIGIDVSKNWFDMAVVGGTATKATRKFDNNASGIASFIACAKEFAQAFVVLEATGGYEMALVRALLLAALPIHRGTPLQVKNFIRSLGQHGKTDACDARALAVYGRERHAGLKVFELPASQQQAMNELLMRRADLVQIRAAEASRCQHPRYLEAVPEVMASLKALVATLDLQIAAIEAQLQIRLDASPDLQARIDAMMTQKGVGQKTALILQTFMPELGSLDRRRVASLAGCAPHPRDSGKHQGYRGVFGGRGAVKRALFMAAMSARRHDPELRAFFEALIARGKKKMVAMVALMRKIIVILNARLRDVRLGKIAQSTAAIAD